jgi:tetratricopeptide (TPR) repeat protein
LVGLVCGGIAGGLIAAGGAGWYRSTRPDFRLRQGQKALLQGDLDGAEDFTQLLENSGHTDEAHLLRGQSYLHRSRLNEAILEYNQIHQENREILAEASLAYGLAFLSVGDHAGAEKLLHYVLTVRPDDVEARRGLARISYDRGAMNQAIDHLEKWSKVDEQNGEPWRWMGLIYKDIGIDRLAVENYRAALGRQLSPQIRAEIAVELAEVLVKQREYTEALACLDGQFSPGEGPAAVAELRAESLFYGLRHSAEAIAVLEQARTSEPPSPRWLWVRALIHIDAGELDAAANLLKQALQADPHECSCRYSLAEVCERQGRRTEAAEQRRLLEHSRQLIQELSDLNRKASDKPRDEGVRRELARVCEQLGKTDMAQMWLAAAQICAESKAKD